MLFLRPLIRLVHQGDDLPEAVQHRAVVLPIVREGAVRAVLVAVLQITELPAAALPQRVKGAITEQAVEIRRVRSGVAGETLALGVLIKGIMLAMPVLGHGISSLRCDMGILPGSRREIKRICEESMIGRDPRPRRGAFPKRHFSENAG